MENIQLYLDYGTTRRFATLLKHIPETVKKISASVAFTQNDLLVKTCDQKKISLEWWGLFNSDISSKIEIVKESLKSPYVKFYPFKNLFHSKLIHFHGYGVYIGSHNLTYNAMYNNVETGVFIPEEKLTEEQKTEIEKYFSFLRDNSVQATAEDVERIEKYLENAKLEIEKQNSIQQNLKNLFEEYFGHLFLLKPGVQSWEDNADDDKIRWKLSFSQEWRETQKYLTLIHERLAEIEEPDWIDKDAEPSIITDQILHFYYDSLTSGNNSENLKNIELINNEYEKNRTNIDAAVSNLLQQWQTLKNPLKEQDMYINVWGKKNKEILRNLKERDLTRDELITVFTQNHAAKNHARQMSNAVFGLPKDFKADMNQRVEYYVDWLLKQKTEENLTIHDTMRYLLFDDSTPLEERVFNTVYSPKYRIDHFGRSIVGELLGWARPEITHIRNNRVNKALRALGFDVTLFSE